MKTKNLEPTKLAYISKKSKGYYDRGEYSWVSDDQIEAFRRYGYSVVVMANCLELEEIRTLQKDKNRPPITQEDINDLLIDLNSIRRVE